MPRPKQTYGRCTTISTKHFTASSSPLKNATPSSPLSSPPPSSPVPSRTPRQSRVVCSDSDDDYDDSDDSDFQDEGHSSVLDSPAGNTRAQTRKPLAQRDANSSVLAADQAGKKGASKTVRHELEEALEEESFYSPHARRLRNLQSRASSSPPAHKALLPQRLHQGPTLTPRASPSPLPFHRRPASPSLTCSVRPKQHHDRPPVPPDPQDAYTAPLLRLVSDPAGRACPTPFQSWADELASFFTITKLAEASYGEVYRLSLRPSAAPSLQKTDESVLKLIALQPPPSARKLSKRERDAAAGMSRVADVASEVRLLQRMTPVPGFTNFRDVRVVRGVLPAPFVAAWRDYHANVRASEFPDPGDEGAYAPDQLWALIEMQNAGQDLEPDEHAGPKVTTVFAVWDAFWSVACAVGKGEEWAGYEHRDLHLGNICVRSGAGGGDWNAWPGVAKLSRKLGFTGLETTIIDYTLSRADMRDANEGGMRSPGSPTRARRGPAVSDSDDDEDEDEQDTAFLNLSADPVLFEGSADDDYQYEIYRLMRNAVFHGDPTVEVDAIPPKTGRKSKKQLAAEAREAARERQLWRQHHSLTNLVWLHFVLWKLCEGVAEWPSESEVGRGGDEGNKAVHRRAAELEECLGVLEGVLEVESIGHMAREGGICSARELVAWAVGEGWLDEADVLNCGLKRKTRKKTKGKGVKDCDVDGLGDLVGRMGLA